MIINQAFLKITAKKHFLIKYKSILTTILVFLLIPNNNYCKTPHNIFKTYWGGIILKSQKNTILFLTGGVVYSLVEILWRGYTHWSMAVTGGFCLLLINIMDNNNHIKLWRKCIIGSGIITFFELFVGCIVNLLLKWNVWDYSRCPMNFFGQICLPFSLLWCFISVPAIYLGRFIQSKLSFFKKHAA